MKKSKQIILPGATAEAKAPTFDPKAQQRQQIAQQVSRQDGEVLGHTISTQMMFACMNFWMDAAKMTDKERMEIISDLIESSMAMLAPLDQMPDDYPKAEIEDLREQMESDFRAWLIQALIPVDPPAPPPSDA